MKKKKDYYESGDVPAETIQRMKDEKEAEEYLKANPDVAPAPRAYKNNDEYLKENEDNKERMKRSTRYSETLKELENPKKNEDNKEPMMGFGKRIFHEKRWYTQDQGSGKRILHEKRWYTQEKKAK